MRRAARVALPVAVVVVASIGAGVLVATRPEAEVHPVSSHAPTVRVRAVQPETVRLTVTTHGTVAPRTESELIPLVSGPIVEVSPALVSGGFFDAGDVLFRIDPRDYEVALRRARSIQVRAQSEFSRAGKELERIVALRERDAVSASHFDDADNGERVARAALEEADAMVEQAERDVERTSVRAPYTGRVREEKVGVGQFVTRGSSVATLYATDYVEVRLPIPDNELAFLDLPLWQATGPSEATGPRVRLSARFAGSQHTWTGRVVRTEGEIDSESRMVHVVARVEHPYRRDASGRPPLAVGLFVEAVIDGVEVADVIVLPRIAMRSNDQVLLVDADDRLRFRRVDVLRAERDRVVIRSGLEPGERVSVSPLDAAIEGMRVVPASGDERAPS